MDLRTMRFFKAVAEEGHFGRAAARLHIAQPPLSRRIRALEEQLGARLFARTPRGAELTEAGRVLLAEVTNILTLAERAKERTRLAAEGHRGRLDVALFGSAILDTIPRVLARFHAARPAVEIHLHSMTKAEQLQALHERRISVGFNRLVPPEPGISVMTVRREALVVAIPEGHALARRSRVRLRDMDNEPLITYPNLPLRGLAHEVQDAFVREGFRFNVAYAVEDVFTALALVAGGLGIAVTAEPATNLRLPGLQFRPLQCAHLSSIELSCLWREDDQSPVLAAFLDVVRSVRWRKKS